MVHLTDNSLSTTPQCGLTFSCWAIRSWCSSAAACLAARSDATRAAGSASVTSTLLGRQTIYSYSTPADGELGGTDCMLADAALSCSVVDAGR